MGTAIQESSGDAYLWAAGLIGRIDGSGADTYVHSDGLGSIRAISDSTGVEVGTTAYDAFGVTRATTGVNYVFGFTGEQVDAETGFVYLRARYLDPGAGRFISQDPIGLAGGDVNLYGYVWNTPTAYVDPSGLQGDYLDAGGGSGGFGGPFIGPVLPPGAAANALKWIILGGYLVPAYFYHDDAINLLEEAGDVVGSCWNFATKPFKGKDQRKGEKAEWAEAMTGLTQKEAERLHSALKEWKKAGGTVPRDDLVELRNSMFPDKPYSGGWLDGK